MANWIKKIGDCIEGALMDGQNQIHDLFAKKATDEEIAKRMQESFRFHIDKAVAVIKTEIIKNLIDEIENMPTGLFDSTPYKDGFKQQLKAKWLK